MPLFREYVRTAPTFKDRMHVLSINAGISENFVGI